MDLKPGKKRAKGSFFFLLVFAVAISGGACSSALSPSQAISLSAVTGSCKNSAAQIQIGDGYMRILCGCSGLGESDGQLFTKPGLTCTLDPGNNAVFFIFAGNSLPHQILSTGSPRFASSPLSDPKTTALPTYGVTLPKASTYQFKDSFNGLTGQIIVP